MFMGVQFCSTAWAFARESAIGASNRAKGTPHQCTAEMDAKRGMSAITKGRAQEDIDKEDAHLLERIATAQRERSLTRYNSPTP